MPMDVGTLDAHEVTERMRALGVRTERIKPL
jgi:hypothetical protein